MAATLLRRKSATAALAVSAIVAAPLAVSALAPTAALAASAPQLDASKSSPPPNGTLSSDKVVSSSDVLATFDQAITGGTGESDGKCVDTTKCAVVLYELNADGSRGLRVPGSVSIVTSSKLPSGQRDPSGTKDTADFTPRFGLRNGNTYDAIVQVTSTTTPALPTSLEYKVYVSDAAPGQLSAPKWANLNNQKAFPFTGVAPPGMEVDVDVVSPDDPSGSGQFDSTGSASVPVCGTLLCPWTVKIDLSMAFANGHYDATQDQIKWSASTSDGQNSSDQSADGPNFGYDNSSVSKPSNSTATPATVTTTVTVSASGPAGTPSYQVTITDVAGNKVQNVYQANPAGTLPPTAIDVTTLDDGTLTIDFQAMNQYGSTSPTGCGLPNPMPPCGAQQTVNKTGSLMPNLGTSLLSSDNGDITFTAAQSQSVPSPSKVIVGFTQTIKESHSDCCTFSGPKTDHSFVCVATTNGNCVDGGQPTVGSDNRSLIWKLAHPLASGTYTVQAKTYSKSNCDDITPQNAANPPDCESFGDTVRIPGTAAPGTPFTFTVDTSPPVVTISSITNPINASNEHGVSAAGTASKGVSTVQVLYTSSGKSPAKLAVNASVTQPSDPNGTATWSAGPSDLSTFPDGPVTVKVTAKKSSGVQGSVTKTIQMQAHITSMSEFTDHATVVAGHAIHITGHLSDENGDPIANATISIAPRFTNGKLGHAATAVTNSGGAYSQTFVPSFTATYVATYKGAPEHDPVTVKTARTRVRAAVSLSGQATQSSPVTVTGHVSPNKAHKTIAIFEVTSSGKKQVGKARLNSSSHFTAHLSLPAGKVKLYAMIDSTSGNLSGQSHILVINVR